VNFFFGRKASKVERRPSHNRVTIASGSTASFVHHFLFEFELPLLIRWRSAGHRGGVEASAIEAEVEVAAHQEEGEVVVEVCFEAYCKLSVNLRRYLRSVRSA
jgi:hypothetical protein